MNYLAIAQYMALAVFLTIALIHWLIWHRARSEITHLLFALTAAAAAANAIAEALMYRADSLDVMSSALRWYVATSGCWAIAAVCFIVSYAPVTRLGKTIAIAIVAVCLAALVINLVSPASYLYTELTGLREVVLPWGEHLWLAIGTVNPIRVVSEIALLMILVVVADGGCQFWRQGKRRRAIVFGVSAFLFVLCFGTHAYFVDTGRLDTPYLSTYGFLALVGLMSYDLAGEVTRQSELSLKLREKEIELSTAIADERGRIAGELHDSVTQTLFSTAAIADALPDVWRRSPEDAMRGLEDLKRLTRGALAEMRTMLLELHPATLVDKPLSELLRQLAAATSARIRVPVEVDIDGNRRFPDDVQITLYRSAQEALQNVVKHAEASHVSLRLRCNGCEVDLTIQDNGRGIDNTHAEPEGIGLQIMRDRVRTIGGQLEIESEPRSGTTVNVHWTDKSAKKQ